MIYERINHLLRKMSNQDWEPVVWKRQEKPSKEENKKYQNPPGTASFRALDSEDPPAPEKVSVDVRMAIQKARVAKKMSQKDLAKILNMQANLINDYESGKAVPNRQILNRIGQALSVKLT